MFTLCFVAFFVFVFHLSFIFSFILHPSCIAHIFFSFPPSSWLMCTFLERGNSTSCTFVEGESHREDAYTNGEKTSFHEKTKFCLFDFMFVFSLLYGALSYVQYLYFVTLIASCLCVRQAYILMPLYFIGCMFRWSFTLLHDHCSHFYMIFLVYDQVAHMFHIMFTWSQFTYYIILVLLSLDLPWRSNVFCVSVSGYRYICSKLITASRFRCE